MASVGDKGSCGKTKKSLLYACMKLSKSKFNDTQNKITGLNPIQIGGY